MSEHFNAGLRIHAVGSGSKAEEPWAVEKCNCGVGFVEHADLLEHIREENEFAAAMKAAFAEKENENVT